MLKLRPYEADDAKEIVKWPENEFVFRQWSADGYPRYPAAPEDMNALYSKMAETVKLYPFTAIDEEGTIVGHLIMRYTDEKNGIIRFGFVIVDNGKRNCGLGKEMLKAALAHAFGTLKVSKVTLGVFENNPRAYACYTALGFKEVPLEIPDSCVLFGEKWIMKRLEINNK